MVNPKLALMLVLLQMVVSIGGSNINSLSLTVVGEVNVTYSSCRITGHELRVTSGNGSNVGSLFRFLGVPYAEPPVGNRRFAAPAPFNFSVATSVNATILPVAATCPHASASRRNLITSEDCLYLSIRSPNLTGSLSVLALLADPADAGVSANDGDALAASTAVVMVTVAYRTGAIGYAGVGNPGLADQRLALQFVHDAVHLFGGDPTRVVLAGHGAEAAAAVGMHAVDAVGGGVFAFQRVVMMSGSIASPLAWWQAPEEERMNLVTALAVKAGCNVTELEPLTCLMNRTLEDVTRAEAHLAEEGRRFAPIFSPTGDSLISLWRSGKFSGSLLIGAAADTGEAALRHVDWSALDHEAFNNLTDREFRYFSRLHSNATTATGRNYLRRTLADWPYAGYGPAVRPQLTRAVGDLHAVCPVWQAAADLTRVGAGGVFVYSHDAADPTGERAADARYLLGEPLLRPDNYTEAHRNLSRLMMEHLAAFVQSGAPDWRKTTTDAFEFIKFDVASGGTAAIADTARGGYGFGPGRCPLSAEMSLANDLPTSAATPGPSFPLPPPPPISEHDAAVFEPVVNTRNTVLANYSVSIIGVGQVTGVTIHTEAGVTMSQFLGIPYAKPPVDKLRFASPVPLEASSSRIILALSMPPLCMQPSSSLNISEDCLYLNIWTPMHAANIIANLPVVVFLHGGFFRSGGIADPRWLGSQVLDHQSLVLVTVGYRLGAFGFLALPELGDAANLGLRDQEMALEWVYRSVDRFGGSRTKVALMGVEAGAASIGYLMARPTLRFQRAVMLTGSPYLPYTAALAGQLRPLHANFTSAYLNCASSDTPLTCLRGLDASLINAKQADFLRDLQRGNDSGGWWPIGAVFSPVVDGNFIQTDPLGAPPARLSSVPLLLGTVDAPGNGLLTEQQMAAADSRHLGNLTHQDFMSLLDKSLGYFPRFPEPLTPSRREAARLRFTRFLFPDGPTEPAAEAQLLAQALGNRHFTCPNWRFLAEAADLAGSRVFSFVLAEDRNDTALRGASLFEDAFYAMGNPAIKSQPLGEERANLSKMLMQSIVAFVNVGNPGWDAYNSITRRIRLLTPKSRDAYILDDAFLGLECAFWNRTLPCVDRPNCTNPTPPTTPPPTTPDPTQTTPPSTTPDPTQTTPPPTTPDPTQTTPESTGSSEEPPKTTPSPDIGGGLSTLALALIIVFSIIGAILLAAAAFLAYKFWWSKRNQQLQPAAQELPVGRAQRNPQPPSGRAATGAEPGNERFPHRPAISGEADNRGFDGEKSNSSTAL